MQIFEKKVDELKPYAKNPRNNEKAVEKVAASIREFGFNVPILIKPDGEIIAGHTRLEAAKALKKKTVPCIIVDDLDDNLIRQLRIVDNKTQELAGWDLAKLVLELSEINEIDMDLFGFGDFGEDNEESKIENLTQNFNAGEIGADGFDDETFDHECPHCGFRWNE